MEWHLILLTLCGFSLSHLPWLTDLQLPVGVFILLTAALWIARSTSDPKSLGENPSVFFTKELN